MKPKHLLHTVLIFAFLQNSFGQIPSWNWARSASGNGYDEASTVTTDISGNVYVSGYFSSDFITIGTITLQNDGLSFNDVFIAKYDPSGNLLWAQRAGSSGNDRGISVTTDKTGDVYLTGYFYSPTITFGPFTLTNAGVVGDIFIVKYDSAGNVLWAKREGGPALEIPFSIAIDDLNNIIVAGRFSSNSITFGTTTLNQAGSMDVFVVKYDPSGNVLWAKGAGGGSNDEAYSVSTDASENIYVAGYFTQPANFGTVKLTSAGLTDTFLAKYNPTGNILWAKRAGGKSDDRATGVKTDPQGNSYVTGFYTNDSISFGSVLIPNTSFDNSFLAKYDTDGNVLWAKGIGNKSRASSVTVSNGNVYACGSFKSDTLTYGSSTLINAGDPDFFILNCNTSGNAKWAAKQTSGGKSSEFANSIATDQFGNLFIAGSFKSEPIFFGTSELNSNRGFDLFVAKLGSTPTGIGDLGIASEFDIYPNPNNGVFTLKNNFNIKVIEIYDLTGRKILSRTDLKQGAPEVLNITGSPSGIYFIRIFDGQKNFTKKLIIRKD